MPQLSYSEHRTVVSEDGLYWEHDDSGEPTGHQLILFEGDPLPAVRRGFTWAPWGECKSP